MSSLGTVISSSTIKCSRACQIVTSGSSKVAIKFPNVINAVSISILFMKLLNIRPQWGQKETKKIRNIFCTLSYIGEMLVRA